MYTFKQTCRTCLKEEQLLIPIFSKNFTNIEIINELFNKLNVRNI